MDLSTIRLEVRERLGELTADFFSDDEVDRAINDGLRRFSAEERWPWLWTEFASSLAAGEDALDLPDDVSFTRVFNLSVDGDTLVTPIELERVEPGAGFRLRHRYSARTGTPRWYYIHKANLAETDAPPVVYTVRFIPTADVTYDVEAQYLAVPSVLGAETDEPMCPEEYQDCIPAWATGKLFLKEFSVSAKAQEQFALYGKVLEQARREVFVPTIDEVVAWGRDASLERRVPLREADWVRSRIPPTLG